MYPPRRDSEILFERIPEVGPDGPRKEWVTIQDYKVDIVFVDGCQGTLCHTDGLIEKVEEEPSRVAKTVKEKHLGTIRCGVDVLAAGVLPDNLSQFLVYSLTGASHTQTSGSGEVEFGDLNVWFVGVSHAVDKSRSDVEHHIDQSETIGCNQESARPAPQKRTYRCCCQYDEWSYVAKICACRKWELDQTA